jgi:hypothetical protein
VQLIENLHEIPVAISAMSAQCNLSHKLNAFHLLLNGHEKQLGWCAGIICIAQFGRQFDMIQLCWFIIVKCPSQPSIHSPPTSLCNLTCCLRITYSHYSGSRAMYGLSSSTTRVDRPFTYWQSSIAWPVTNSRLPFSPNVLVFLSCNPWTEFWPVSHLRNWNWWPVVVN